MKNETITIDGEAFQVVTTKEPLNPYVFDCAGRTLDNIYRNPSDTKKHIWNAWRTWAINNNPQLHKDGTGYITKFGVDSGNCMTFTISGLYRHTDGNLYGIHITAWNNYLYRL